MTKKEIMDCYEDAVANHYYELEEEDEEEAEDFDENWYELKDVIISPAIVTLVMNKPIEPGDGEQILAYAFGFSWYDRHEVESGDRVTVNVLDI